MQEEEVNNRQNYGSHGQNSGRNVSGRLKVGQEGPASTSYSLEEQQLKLREYEHFLQDRVVEVQKPQLIREGLLTSYKLYKVKTRKNNSQFYDTVVGRRFNDFEFLHHEIVDNYGGYVIPKLPAKNFLANLNLETQEFADGRTRELQKYLEEMMKHSRVKLSSELRNFLFDEEYDFSFSKGEFSQQSAALEGFKAITTSVLGITKTVYARFAGRKDRRCEFSKDSQIQQQLRLFQREVEDLIKVIREISSVIGQSYQEFSLVHELSILSGNPHLSSLQVQQEFILFYQQLITEFQEISTFVENCKEAIMRTKGLRAEVEELEEQQAALQAKERENPRNRELDVLRSKIQRGNAKCQKWVSSLRKELTVYTSEGKTMMQQFVRRFSKVRGQLYAAACLDMS